MKQRKYTLVFHDYIGYGSYVIHFKRVHCKPERLEYYSRNPKHGLLHFVINGWPKITFPNGSVADYKIYAAAPRKRVCDVV